MDKITVMIAPESDRVRILARAGTADVLKAVLGPARAAHPRAAATLLEGLSLWHQQALSVVLLADDSSDGSALCLCDGLGFGQRSVHYAVGLAVREERGRRRRGTLRGLGDFRDLRQLTLWEADQ